MIEKLSNEDFYKIKYLASEGARLATMMNAIQSSYIRTKEEIEENKVEYDTFNDELKKKYELTKNCSFDMKTGVIIRDNDNDVSKPSVKKN